MSETSSSMKGSTLGVIAGFILVFLGTLAIVMPFISGIAVTVFIGLLFIVAGIVVTIFAFKADSWSSGILRFLVGGATLVCGIFFLIKPILGMVTLTSILLAYFIVDGIFVIIAGFQVKPEDGWGWIVFSGFTSLLLGALLWYEWPLSGTFAIGILAGIRLIFSGWSIAMFSMMTKKVDADIKEIESSR